MKKLVVVKLGGSLITDKSKPYTLRRNVLERIGRELSDLDRPIILVHGGGSYAHPVAKQYRVYEGNITPEHMKGFIETSKIVRRLNLEVVEALSSSGLKCIGIPASTIMITKDKRIETCNLDSILMALNSNIVPVTCGDVVFDRKLGFTVLSGDTISSYLSIRLKAEKLIYAIDVDGVYVRDRQTGEVKIAEYFTPGMWVENLGAANEDVTGGIVGKIEEGFQATERCVEVILVKGLIEETLRTAVLGGEVLCTKLKIS
ncbi:MAG: isopentenyl phosphate kinase [Nitrososphaerota archaeon]